MNRWSVRLACIVFCVLAFPFPCPAPLVYRPGEGWVYEPVGGGKWIRTRAQDQLEVARTAFDKKDYSTAFKAARRTVRVWRLSDYAPKAQYLLGRCYEAEHQDERAFREYQRLLEKYPKAEYDQSVAGQAIATFSGFMVLYPGDSRAQEAQKMIGELKTEQARGSFEIARFYEKKRRWDGARTYYNDVVNILRTEPGSPYAEAAKKRIDAINKRAETRTARK